MKSAGQMSVVRPEGLYSPVSSLPTAVEPVAPREPTHRMASASYSPLMSGPSSMGVEALTMTMVLSQLALAAAMTLFSSTVSSSSCWPST